MFIAKVKKTLKKMNRKILNTIGLKTKEFAHLFSLKNSPLLSENCGGDIFRHCLNGLRCYHLHKPCVLLAIYYIKK